MHYNPAATRNVPINPVLIIILLLLPGHLDVQPAAQTDGWDTDPFVLTRKPGKPNAAYGDFPSGDQLFGRSWVSSKFEQIPSQIKSFFFVKNIRFLVNPWARLRFPSLPLLPSSTTTAVFLALRPYDRRNNTYFA